MPSSPRPGVCAVIVTYNRKNMLLDCIASVQRQTRPVDAIFVIDNHSTDGTAQVLAERYPEIPVFVQPTNRGSAGGFKEALKVGHERGFEWIWIMDDDIEMLPDGLEKLLQYKEISKFIQARRRGPDGILSLEALWDVSMGTCLNLRRDYCFEKSDRDWVPVQWGCFEGPLVHRSVVDNVGLPEERFWLSGDDMMYGFAASFYTTVIYCRFVLLDRKLPLPASTPPLRWYLMVRNRFLIYELLCKQYKLEVTPRVFHLGMLQFAIWGTLHILRGGNAPQNPWECLKKLWLGLRDGWIGRFGPPRFAR